MASSLGGMYSTGVFTLDADGKVATGNGTAWTLVAEQGDWLFANGHIGIIASVDDDTHLTLEMGWTGGDLTDAPYRIVKMSWLRYDPALTQAKLRALLVALEAPTVIFFVEGAAPDPGLGLDGQYALKSNSGAWKLWFKQSGTWVLQGSPVGLSWLGPWNAATTYTGNSAVTRLGSTYVSKTVNTNAPPESNPNDWDLAADKGGTGDVGPIGETGPQGETLAVQWNFSAEVSDSDPGNGNLRIDHAIYGLAGHLYVDDLDRNGASQTALLDSLDDSTTPNNRGTLFLQQVGASAVYAIFTVVGDVVDGIGYRKVPVSHVMSSGTFTEGLPVAVSFARTGDKGLDGLGAGDTISDISSVTSGRLVKYSDPSGKHITDAGASIGTSGHSVPVLDADNSWSGAQSFDGGLSVPDAAFAYAKLQDVSATSRFLGRKSPGAGVLEELTPPMPGRFSTSPRELFWGSPRVASPCFQATPSPTVSRARRSLYYTPYLGQLVPIYDGASWIMHDIGGELSQALSDATKSPAAAAANSLYDVFVWNDGGTYRLSRGSAWTNDSTRSSGLIRIKGILVNAAAIANGPAANRGTYVGTVMTNAAAQVRFTLGSAAAGGGAAELGVWNMYNRVSLRAMVQDTTVNWTYAGASFRPANNSSNNRVTWVVGLNEDVAEVRYSVMGQASSPEPVLGVSLAYAGIGIDTISAAIGVSTAASISSASTINLIGLAQGAWSGLTGVGKHFVQAMEASPTGSVVSYFGADHMALIFAYRM